MSGLRAGPLTGRGAVITGGGRGIGAAAARALAGAGAAIVVAARTASEIDAVARELRAQGARAWGIPCDATSEESVRALAEAAAKHLGAVDILVNNAGDAASSPLARITLAEWNRTLAVNATSTFLCSRELAPAMAERGWGRIVNVASIAGLEGGKYVAHYTAAKHAVIGFTRSVALELRGSGVTVNAVCPAYVDTPLTERTLARVETATGRGRDQALAAVLATTGQERLLAPEEVAAAILALCLDTASNVTGTEVVMRAEGSVP